MNFIVLLSELNIDNEKHKQNNMELYCYLKQIISCINLFMIAFVLSPSTQPERTRSSPDALISAKILVSENT